MSQYDKQPGQKQIIALLAKPQEERQPKGNPARHSPDYIDEYKHLLDIYHLDSEINQDELAERFSREGLKYSTKDFEQRIHITIEENSSNFEALKINIKYGYFSSTFNLISIDKDNPLKQMQQSYTGSYGSVHQYNMGDSSMAIKCINIIEVNFEIQFREVIKEYLFLAIASALGIAPKVVNIFGFDILLFRDAFVFTMEFCEIGKHRNGSKASLSHSLLLLHQLNIIHLDIKPDNIGFSFLHNEHILIDFGLTRMVKQKIGKKTYTRFCGSMHYCSGEMLELFTKEDYGYVDLYYNDAFALIKSLNELQQRDKECEHFLQECTFNNYMISNNKRILNKLRQDQPLLNAKFILFELSCSRLFDWSKITHHIKIMKAHPASINNFILNLPLSIHLISFYNMHLVDSFEQLYHIQLIKNSFGNELADGYQLTTYYFQRISEFKKRSNSSQSMHQEKIGEALTQIEDLNNINAIKFLRKETYHLALIKFIKINSPNKKFKGKIQACKVFNQLYRILDDYQQSQLYKQVVRYIFRTALTLQDGLSLQTIKNCIETVVILEVVSEKYFFQAYQRVLMMMGVSFIEKMSVIIQFITSLQFIKEKYRKEYCYEVLYQAIMNSLDSYLGLQEPNIKNYNQIVILNKLKMITAQSRQVIQPSSGKLQQAWQNIEDKQCSVTQRRLNETIFIYIFSGFIISELQRYNFCEIQHLELLYILVNKFNYYSEKFMYVEFCIYDIAYKTYRYHQNDRIYRLFHEELHHFEEHKYFNIYLYNKILQMNKVLAHQQNLASYRGLPSNQYKSQEKQVPYEQIFSILDYVIKNCRNFHQQLGFLMVNNLPIYYSTRITPFLSRLIEDNKQIIPKLSNNYHKQRKAIDKTPMYQITVVTNIYEFLTRTGDKDQAYWQIRVPQFLAECQQVLQDNRCFQCKIHSMIRICQINCNTLQLHGNFEQSIYKTIDLLILHYKNQQLLPITFDVVVFLVRTWMINEKYLKQFDFKRLLYEYIISRDNYRFCLMEIPEYNLFLALYLYVFKNLQRQTFVMFIANVARSLIFVRSVNVVNKYYFSILQALYQLQNENSQNWLSLHQEVINQLITLVWNQRIPHLALYFYAFFTTKIGLQLKLKLFRAICYLINLLDKYSRSIIMNNYFHTFYSFMPIPPRKRRYLASLQMKVVTKKIDMKEFRSVKAKKLPKRPECSRCVQKIKTFLNSYHFFL